jgi:hypothetical protein
MVPDSRHFFNSVSFHRGQSLGLNNRIAPIRTNQHHFVAVAINLSVFAVVVQGILDRNIPGIFDHMPLFLTVPTAAPKLAAVDQILTAQELPEYGFSPLAR